MTTDQSNQQATRGHRAMINAEPQWNRKQLWLHWAGANALAECLGLGLTFAAGYLLFTMFGEPTTTAAAFTFGLLMVLTGFLEGSIVGAFQWNVIRRALPDIKRRTWVRATLIGALTAWFLGSIPSTLASMQVDPGVPVAEPPQWIVLALAAGMGAVLGIVLALPQWFALRRQTQNSWIWIPANSLAWLAGMPIIFAAIDLAFNITSIVLALILFASALLVTGAVVGAIHGLALIRLQRRL